MTDYAPLLNEQDETLKVYLDPVDAVKLVTRIRKVRFFLRVDLPVLTEFAENGEPTRCYDISESLMVSAAQALKVLAAKVNFNELKAENGGAPGKVEVARLGNCIFIG
ncbi:MAG: hypothetical protein COW54_02290 [Rhodobacteraceae bacterium CG17_big_fil_post_rev_8_21_14_2_50_63_15]|nr:hypothetical protein [Roseovarius sp.]PIV79796.1 MAG: hypothetical protein COW54_02290 [Rhodobacteraceae bacterium CG17_big_fil_post_rev_8_21_14_2_50_63_15]